MQMCASKRKPKRFYNRGPAVQMRPFVVSLALPPKWSTYLSQSLVPETRASVRTRSTQFFFLFQEKKGESEKRPTGHFLFFFCLQLERPCKRFTFFFFFCLCATIYFPAGWIARNTVEKKGSSREARIFFFLYLVEGFAVSS